MKINVEIVLSRRLSIIFHRQNLLAAHRADSLLVGATGAVVSELVVTFRLTYSAFSHSFGGIESRLCKCFVLVDFTA